MPRRLAPSQSAYRQAGRQLRALTGRRHVLLAGRAAAGIWAALTAWEVRDRPVWLPANTCYIVLWAALRSGAQPALVDVDARTGNWTPEILAAQPGPLPAVIIPAHMYGLPAPIAAITAWAHERGVKVIEDAALALGGSADGRPAGAWGDGSVFSFGLGKIVDVELGGALLTDDPALAAETARILAGAPVWDGRLTAFTEQWHALYWALHQYETHNPALTALYPALFALYRDLTIYRLPASYWFDLPAALADLPADAARRAGVAAVYDRLLKGLPTAGLARPAGSMVWRYPLLAPPERRDDLLGALWAAGLHDVTRWYPALRHMAAALRPDLSFPPTPAADDLAARIINLPLDARAADIAALIARFFEF